MLVQKKASSKKNLVLGAVGIVLLISTFIFLYFTVFSDASVELETAGASGSLLPVSRINTQFDTELFDDPRIEGLKQYGPEVVGVAERGRKADPFEAF